MADEASRGDVATIGTGVRADGTAGSDADYAPRTPLGRRLLELRRRIIASGEGLATRDELEREIAGRRGGVEDASDGER